MPAYFITTSHPITSESVNNTEGREFEHTPLRKLTFSAKSRRLAGCQPMLHSFFTFSPSPTYSFNSGWCLTYFVYSTGAPGNQLTTKCSPVILYQDDWCDWCYYGGFSNSFFGPVAANFNFLKLSINEHPKEPPVPEPFLVFIHEPHVQKIFVGYVT